MNFRTFIPANFKSLNKHNLMKISSTSSTKKNIISLPDSDSNSRSKKKDKKHAKSLSPLAKRMLLTNIDNLGDYQFNNHSFDGPSSSVNMDDHELKVS